MFDVAVIGCGIVGAAAAYELSRYELDIVLLEAENDVATGTTKANSAILHAGYDPAPGTLMAKLGVEGAALAKTLCERLSVPYRQTGSLVLAFSEGELETLRELCRRGVENGVPGLELLDGAQARALEPELSAGVAGALHAPSAAVVSPWEFALALAETAVRNGVDLRLECAVNAVEAVEGGWRLTTSAGTVEARAVLNAAGLHAGVIHEMVAPPAFALKPNRGEYYLLDKSEGSRVGRIIFQCPTKVGKGVLVAPTVHGNLIVGPNAEDIPCELLGTGEALATTAEGLEYVAEMARKSVPGVDLRQSIRNFAGVRAQSDIDDFVIREAEGCPGFISLAGIRSPGLSAAPAIAKYAVELLAGRGLPLREKAGFVDRRETVRFHELPPEERARLAAENPDYGHVICRCESVTEGEILDAMRAPIPPRSVDGVKRRVNAGMGRCQGGFCGPRVVELLARELGISPPEILQDKAGSHILTGSL